MVDHNLNLESFLNSSNNVRTLTKNIKLLCPHIRSKDEFDETVIASLKQNVKYVLDFLMHVDVFL